MYSAKVYARSGEISATEKLVCPNLAGVGGRSSSSFRFIEMVEAILSLICTLRLTLLLLLCNVVAWTPNASRFSTGVSWCIDDIQVYIRDVLTYHDLDQVSELLMDSFCTMPSAGSSKHLYRVSELSRLRESFSIVAKPSCADRMLVAVTASHSDNGEVIGFLDLHTQAPKFSRFPNNPRPYICELAVKKTCRRKKVASALMAVCEEICKSPLQQGYLYLRVLRNNHAAINMYSKMGYITIESPGEPLSLVLMRKKLP